MLSKSVYRGLIPCYRLDAITTLVVVDVGDNNNFVLLRLLWVHRSRSISYGLQAIRKRVELRKDRAGHGVGNGDTLVMRAACWSLALCKS